MIQRFAFFLLLFCSANPMDKDICPMSADKYRNWFKSASDEQIAKYVIKPFLNRQLMPAEQYDALRARKAPEWALQKALRVQKVKCDRLKNYGAVALAFIGWCCLATYVFQERITEIVGAYL